MDDRSLVAYGSANKYADIGKHNFSHVSGIFLEDYDMCTSQIITINSRKPRLRTEDLQWSWL